MRAVALLKVKQECPAQCDALASTKPWHPAHRVQGVLGEASSPAGVRSMPQLSHNNLCSDSVKVKHLISWSTPQSEGILDMAGFFSAHVWDLKYLFYQVESEDGLCQNMVEWVCMECNLQITMLHGLK